MNEKQKSSELKIARFIRVVILASGVVILAGLILYLVTGTSGYAGDMYPIDPLAILIGAAALKPYAVMMTGLFILILTPFLRVGVSIIGFIREKDGLYVAITSFVFVVLLVSLFLGKGE